MLTDERLNEILQLVNQKGSITVTELTELLGASESTIRRDLNTLHREGKLLKVHGGATSLAATYHTKDDSVSNRMELNRPEKLEIARYAASIVQPHDFIYLDAGTTTELMIPFLPIEDIQVVTNGLRHAVLLSQRGITTYLLGGRVKGTTEAIVGSQALSSLELFHFTIGFFGANGISMQAGFTTPEMSEALIKKEAVNKCKTSYVLADPSKFDQISSISFGTLENSFIITTATEKKTYQELSNLISISELNLI